MVALLAVVATLIAAFIAWKAVEAQRDTSESSLRDQRAANTQAREAQGKLLRRQARQGAAAFLLEQRSAAYNQLLERDQALRTLETTWNAANRRGDLATISASKLTAKESYRELARARIAVQLVARCEPRTAVRGLDDAHKVAIIALRRNEAAGDVLVMVRKASGKFLAASRADLRAVGKARDDPKLRCGNEAQ